MRNSAASGPNWEAPKAITAMAHKLAVLFYRMLRFGQEYIDRGQTSTTSAIDNNRFLNLTEGLRNWDSVLFPHRARRLQRNDVSGENLSGSLDVYGAGKPHWFPRINWLVIACRSCCSDSQ